MSNENLPATKPDYAIDFEDPRMIRTLKATVAQGLTDEEFLLFAQHCKGTGLNPFKKEVWAIKAGGRLQIMTGINGFLAIANSHPLFDGMEVEVDDDAKPTKATCRVYRKDRKFPAVGVALLKEYGKNTPIWNQMPRVMLTKAAKSIALREAFPQELNGMYTDDEMPAEYHAPSNGTHTAEVRSETAAYVEGIKARVENAQANAVSEDSPDFVPGLKKYPKLSWRELPPEYLEWLGNNERAPAKWQRRAIIELKRRAADEAFALKDEKEDPCGGDDLPENFGKANA